jgi:hypothetical protein
MEGTGATSACAFITVSAAGQVRLHVVADSQGEERENDWLIRVLEGEMPRLRDAIKSRGAERATD